jgi:hypothetical protein
MIYDPLVEFIAWNAAADLPTEDVGKPKFARRSVNAVVPRGDYSSSRGLLIKNPVDASSTRWAGIARNARVDNAVLHLELEGIEAQWQRARPRRDLIINNSMSLQTALETLLTERQQEFAFLQWLPIPYFFWPDGSLIPNIPALQVVVDSSDPNRPSVYDEVLNLLRIAPGYSVNFTADGRLKIVIPPFDPNAVSPVLVNHWDGHLEPIGYSNENLTRYVRVISKPYKLSDGAISLAPATSIRVNVDAGVFSIAVPQDTTPGTVDYNEKTSIYTYYVNTWDIPFHEDIVLVVDTIQLNVNLDVYRLIPQPSSNVARVADFVATFNLPIDGTWHKIIDTGNHTFGLVRLPISNFARVFARYNGRSISIRLEASITTFGGSTEGVWLLPRFTDYHHGYRVRVEATAQGLQQSANEYEGIYFNQEGAVDLPDVDLSLSGISDPATLTKIAWMIARRNNQTANKYRLRLFAPWILHPDQLGETITDGIHTYVLDSVRERVESRREAIVAESDWECWVYTPITECNTLVYGSYVLVYDSQPLCYSAFDGSGSSAV